MHLWRRWFRDTTLPVSLACSGCLCVDAFLAVDALLVLITSIAERDLIARGAFDFRCIRKACMTAAAARGQSAFLYFLRDELLLDTGCNGIQIFMSHQDVEYGHQAASRRITSVHQPRNFANVLLMLWIKANDRAQMVLKQLRLVFASHALDVSHDGDGRRKRRE